MDKGTIVRKVISGFAWEGSTKLIIQVFSWFTTIFVARLLSPEDYGVVAISGIFIGVLAIIADMGFMSALINQKEVTRDEIDCIFWLNAVLSLILFAAIYLLAPFIAHFYKSDVLVDIIRVSALVLPLSSLQLVPTALAMRNMDFRYRALADMAGQFAVSVSAITLALNGFGVWSLVYSVVIGRFVVLLIYLPLLEHFPRFMFSIRKVWHMVRYGTHLMMSQILEFLTHQSDVFVISIFLTQQQLGYYSMGFQLATMPLEKIGSIFNRIAFPSISRIKEDLEQSKNLFINMHKYLLILSFPILTGVAIVAEDLIILVLTEKWLPIVPILQTLCILNLLRVSGMIMPYFVAGMGKSSCVFKYHLLGAMLLPIAFLVGVQFGIIGVLVSWFIVFPILYYYILNVLSNEMKFGLKEFVYSSRSPFVATLIMALSIYAIQRTLYLDHIYNLALSVSIGVISYIIVYRIFFASELNAVREKYFEIKNTNG